MNSFEKWQVGIMIIQSSILLATFSAAFYIGLKQNEINKNLLDLNYSPSIEFTYDSSSKQFNIYNKGKTNIKIFGTQLNNGEKSIDEGRQITPSGLYYIFLTPELERTIRENVKLGETMNIPFNIFIEDDNKSKYLIANLLYITIQAGKIEILTQTLTTTKVSNW